MKRTLLITITTILVLQTHSNDIQLTTLKNPILPIELGNAKLIYNKHTFLHYVDLDSILKQLTNIEKYFLTIKSYLKNNNATNPISYHGLSESAILRTSYLIETTQDKLQNLYPHIRIKRGLFNIVGKANKWLFGTLDADDGKKYDKAIKSLEHNQRNIINELNLQVSLSKNLVNSYNKTISVLNENQKKLEYSLRVFKNVVEKTINDLNNYISFQGIVSQINLDCQNLITFIDNLEDAIMFAKLNALHNSIISSSELQQMLDYLKTIYNNAEIPYFKNVLSYYQFLGTQVTFSNTKVIFAIHVPIIRPESFTFHHLYPIVQNHKIFIPKYPYLARKEEKIQFEEAACPSLEEVYYCNEDFHPNDHCTLQLLEGSSFDSCPILEVNTQEAIAEQITQEEILVIPMKKERLFSKCNTDQFLEISLPTLVKVPKTCQIQIGTKKFINDIRFKQGKPLILPDINISHFNSSVVYRTPNLTKLNFEDIYRLNDMANQLSPITAVNEAPDSSTIIGYIILCVAILLSLFLLWKYKTQFGPISKLLKRRKADKKIEETNTSPINSIIASA